MNADSLFEGELRNEQAGGGDDPEAPAQADEEVTHEHANLARRWGDGRPHGAGRAQPPGDVEHGVLAQPIGEGANDGGQQVHAPDMEGHHPTDDVLGLTAFVHVQWGQGHDPDHGDLANDHGAHGQAGRGAGHNQGQGFPGAGTPTGGAGGLGQTAGQLQRIGPQAGLHDGRGDQEHETGQQVGARLEG